MDNGNLQKYKTKVKDNPAFHPYAIIRKVILPFWPIYLGCILIAYFAAKLKLQSEMPIYQVNASIVLHQGGNMDGAVLQELGIKEAQNSVENEIQILKSTRVSTEVTKRLGAYTRIIQLGDISKAALPFSFPIRFRAVYEDSIKPFNVIFKFDPTSNAIVIGEKKYKLKTQRIQILGQPFMMTVEEDRLHNVNMNNPYSLQVLDIPTSAQLIANALSASKAGEKTSIINVSFQDLVVENAEKIVNEALDIYSSYSVAEKRKSQQYSLDFVENRLELVNNELEQVEGLIENFKKNNGFVDVTSQAQSFLNDVKSNDSKIAEIDLQLSILTDIENYIRGKWSSQNILPSTLGITEPRLGNMLMELYKMESTLSERKKISGQRDEVILNLEEEILRTKNNLFEIIKNTRSSLKTTKMVYQSQLENKSSELQKMPSKERQLLDISRQQAIKNEIFTFLLKKREELAINFAATVSDSRIFEKAGGGEQISPKPKLVYIFYITLGILLPLLTIYWFILLGPKVRFKEDIEYLTDVPIIGEIMFDKQKRNIVIGLKDRGVLSETLRTLRTKISNILGSSGSKIILVSSSIPGEGKSFLSVNLGISYSLTGKKALLIGGDMRKPTLHKSFRINSRKGLSSYLSGASDWQTIVYETEYDHLSIIPSGVIPPNPTELFENPLMEELMNRVKKEFDIIIIDSPPLGLVSDAELLAKYADMTIFLTRQGKTFKDALVEVVNRAYDSGQFRNMSLVFNGVKPTGIGKYSYYGYGGYGYGGYGYGGYGYYGSGVKKTGYGFYLKRIFGRIKG
jgi:tyrosine-protein kinase Etk/Wzc